jgi:hypothetical protein
MGVVLVGVLFGEDIEGPFNDHASDVQNHRCDDNDQKGDH